MSSPDALIRVLFVEDSEDDCFMVARQLRTKGFVAEHRRVETREGFLAAIQDSSWDVILCDHSMPHFTSIHALAELRDRGLDIPLIIVSGTIGEELAVEAMRAGASDYVLKHNLTRLPHVLTRELREAESRRARREAEASLRASEEQLRHAQKMEAVGRLASGVAHDFNNLLTAIIGFSEFALEQTAESDPRRGDIEQVLLAANRATQLTTQLLAFSRRQPSTPRVVMVNDVVVQIVPMLRRLLGAGISIETALDTDTPPVLIDRGLLEQVLMNLAVNSRDAMDGVGTLTLRSARRRVGESVEAAPGLPSGDYAQLDVIDTGHGMDDATRARVFEPFFTTKGAGKGTGLGLSTVAGIMQQSGGAIELDTAPGRGATFSLLFPACAPDAQAAPAVSPAPAELRGHESILLVEHEPVVADVIKTVLGEAGYTVVQAANTAEAVQRLASDRSIALMLANPILDGATSRELVRRLMVARPELRLLYLTGHVAAEAMPDGLARDPALLLRKPFTPQQLLVAVRGRLDAPRQ